MKLKFEICVEYGKKWGVSSIQWLVYAVQKVVQERTTGNRVMDTQGLAMLVGIKGQFVCFSPRPTVVRSAKKDNIAYDRKVSSQLAGQSTTSLAQSNYNGQMSIRTGPRGSEIWMAG